jgi:hypothetical protein
MISRREGMALTDLRIGCNGEGVVKALAHTQSEPLLLFIVMDLTNITQLVTPIKLDFTNVRLSKRL